MSVNSEPGVLPAEPIVAGFRLSPQQRRLWSLGGGDAVSPYRASCAVRIQGALDVEALGSAVRRAVERHEILRTTFRSLEEVRVPLQVVGDHPPRLAPRVELAQAAALDALQEEMRRLPIDIGRGPLVHGRLAAVGPEEWALLLAHPALCGDAVGLRGLVREIAAGYGALGGGAALDAEPLQYADLSEWQNDLLAAPEAEHWRRQGPASPPRLPCELAASGRFAPRSLPVPLGEGVDRAIGELVLQQGATARAFLLACWQIALVRLSSQRELLLGVADDGRSYAGLEQALGPFAKHLPLVCRWDPSLPFATLLRRCEAELAELRQWQEYYDPEQGSPPEGEPAYLPVGFACEEELPPLAAAGVTFTTARVEAWIDRFHLALVSRRSDSLRVELCYDERRFRQRDVARLGDQLRVLIGSALAAPLSPVATLSMLDAAERHRLVVELNRTEVERPPARGVHEIFARRLESAAGRPALRCEDRVLTHGELSGRANQLAHRLRRFGVGPEVPVAICCERSLEAVVAILGVLKAGGAYVPLDPGQPAARLGAMLEEVGAPVLISQERLAATLPARGARVVCLDADWNEIARESDRDPLPLGEPENLAYVIFTSGSTGRPKGVGVEHRQLLNYVAGAIAALDLPAEASFATVSTFAADLGHTMIFPSLCSGGCLHVITQERLADPAAVAEYFARFPVDCLKIVPSHLAALLSHSEPGRVLPRRRLVLGGEPCRRSLVAAIQGLAPSCELFNHYGPTETTVGVLVHRIDPAAVDAPLGRPLANSRVYLLDGDLRPVPVWVPGEIYVGGAGVARGYVGHPGQTAERFVPDPFADGSRLYRTGDLGRFLPGGEVEFLGRADDQVKIRGFRVEPGEIEAQLRAHPAVAQALVMGRDDGAGERRLVGYVVLRDGQGPAAQELRGWLAERLPEPMVPAAFVELDAFPLGPNGKVDRSALPMPKATAAAAAYEPPRSPLEELLAGIWAVVLRHDRVGVHDDFFAIGGHSLLATQVISRVRHALGREAPLRLLFESPTLERFAARVEELASGGADFALPPVEPVARGGDLPLSFAQQRLWFLDQLEPGSPVYHIPAAFRLSGVLDVPALARSLGEIVRRHEALRTTFPAVQGRPVQKIGPPVTSALPLVDLAVLPPARRQAEALRIATLEARRPFDLARGPLYRTALLRLAGREHALLATLHHIVGDGWSKGIIAREMGALYPAFASGQPSPLPELPIQYADFAQWQRRWLEGEVLDSQLAYWRRQLAGAPPVLTLPSDRPRSTASRYAGDHLHFQLPPALSAGLRRLSQSAGTTLFMTLLAGFQVLLSRLSGQLDVCIGTPIAGRHRLEIEGLIGFFVNTLVLRGDLTGGPAFNELQARVRGVVLEAYARQDLPFERLVEELDPERSLGLNPLFQVMLVLHNAPPERLELPGLTLSALSVATEASKFDLAMPLLETAEGLAGALEYDTWLFDEATVLRWLHGFETLLGEVVERPETPLWDLPLLGAAERHQLLVEWQPAPAPETSRRGLHQLFEAQAARTPERAAVVQAGSVLTYAELDARANRLARRLVALGIGPERVAAVVVARSPATLVALLAVLKAGGAYLPVAPDLPPDRIAFLLQDSRAAAVLPPGTGPLAGLDEDAGGPGDAWGLPVAPGQLAYVIYTSGSTGQPKGVGVSHAAAAAHLAAIPEAFGLDPADRILQFSSLSFDVSLEQIFSALLLGATLVMRGEETWGEAELGQQIQQQGVTVANLPTAYWHQVAQPGFIAGLRGGSLRLMIAGGEAMLPATSELWLQGPARLLNAYGPTEATITATLCPVTADLSRAARVPIGRPLGERTVQVRDALGALVPIGVPGELLLGGPLLARGYLDQPQLTAERFVPDPLGAAGSRLYRTGDLARVLPDGAVEFLGRTDHQVKIRGFRVELGEIEAAIARHPKIDSCAVVSVGPAAGGDRHLVAYVVARSGSALEPSDVRRHLERELPEYMRPAAFVLLDALPLTPTGKLDRRALPAWQPDPIATSADAPANPLEEIVAAVWSEVLRREEIGPRDNFFDLGGHSLLAVQVVSRLREAFAVELPLRTLFEAPTVAGLARAIDELRRLEGETPVPRIEPVSRDGELPLSFAQERLWFLHQLQPDSSAYHMRLAFRLGGILDRAALEDSLAEILRRHEVLRTRFDASRGEPLLVISPPTPAALGLIDLSGLPPRERELAAGRLLADACQRPFDLASGPPVRLGLARLAADDHLLLAVCHHIVSDGWSIGVLQRELAVLYAAYSGRRPSPLPELPIQYADYAAWQRRWLAGEALEALVGYWRRQLGGVPPIELPLDRPRPQAQTFGGRRELLRLPPRLRDACLRLGRREAATLFMTLLAAWTALLARYSGSEDVPVGTPVANRDRPELEGLVGLFLNTLVLRTGLAGDPAAAELVRRVRETALQAFAHQQLPFEKVVEELQPERDPSRTPLFQVMFVLQTAAEGALALPGLRARPVGLPEESAKLDLTLTMHRSPDGLVGAFYYRQDLFDAPTIRRLGLHLEALLDGMTADPERPLSQLPLLSDAERHQAVHEWGDARPAAPPAPCLHRRFASQAARTPDAVAVQLGAARLTYRELSERACRLARRLIALGVRPGDLVGLCLERSLEMVAAILGVLEAGGAYLPLDPDYPRERLAFALEDSRVAVVVTQQELAAALPASAVRLLRLDAERAEIDAESAASPGVPASAELPAYVIYTSGSTGRPKGVVVTHANVGRLFESTGPWFGFGPADVWTLFHSYAFDFSVWELWGALLHGGRLVVVPSGIVRSPEAFHELLAAEGVTVLNQTPSAFRQLLWAEGSAGPPAPELALRWVVFGGEALELASLVPWFERHGDERPRLVNMYGITETTVHVTWRPLRGEDAAQARASLIGRALPDLALRVLDRGLAPLPIGVPGEIHVGGAGVALGYLNQPELTAARFVPDPFGAPGARLYRSGDLARALPDGDLEYLGRSDDQVKIRGFRIELGEIEDALARHPGVRQVAVAAVADGAGGRRLAAYVVPQPGAAVSFSELRALARARLPEVMVPSTFTRVDSFRLTPSGKLDRRALPAPLAETDAELVPPRNVLEELIASLWSAVLGRESVGATDDFFALGGHSLTAAQVAARLRQALGREVALGLLFQHPTVAGLAAALETAERDAAAISTPPITRAARDGELPLSSAQLRLWFLECFAPGTAVLNIPHALRFHGRLALPALAGALTEIVRRHEVLRTIFPAAQGRPVQVIGPPRPCPLPLVDLSALPAGRRDPEAAELTASEARRPFDLAHGPLLRATVLRLGEDDHSVLFTMHHIVSDGWSTGILVRELSAVYRALLAGRPSTLRELPIQYADYAVWQSRGLAEGAFDAHLAYWRQRLAGAAPLLLPSDRPRPPVRSSRGATRGVDLGQPLGLAVGALSRQEDATLFMTLLAAFQALLGRLAGQDDIVAGTDYANRDRLETEGLIGFFVNQLVLRADLGGNPSFRELLARVRRAALAAYAHRDLPFERLVEALNPRRGLDAAPLFQVKLILQNAPAAGLDLPGVQLRPVATQPGAAQLDLTLAFTQSARGLTGWINYSTDLFDAATVDRWVRQLADLLAQVVRDPEARLDELARYLNAMERKQLMTESTRREASFQRFKAAQPKPVSLPAGDVVRMGSLHPGQRLPLLVTPAVEDVDLAAWSASHRELIESKLREHGAILFRGFGIAAPESFERFALTLCSQLFHENGEHPRESVSGNVYTPVFYPADQRLLWHNENSFNFQWPAKILFCCVQPPATGGETPIVDSREVFAALPAALRERFLAEQVMYVRNFGGGLGLDWRTVFQVADQEGLEEHCRAHRIELEWRDGDRLHTRSVRPAAIRHPATGEMSWFNQAQHWHLSCLDPETRRSLESLFGEEDLPRNCYLGDGSPIADPDMAEILAAYRRLEVSFPWQRGDVLLVDNVLTAHGRNPFTGERKLLVAMGEMTSFEEV